MNKRQKSRFIRLLVAAPLTLIIWVLQKIQVPHIAAWGYLPLYLIPYIIIGHDILKKSWKGILHRRAFDENLLMSAATIGAFFLGEYTEAVGVMIFYQLGEFFQSYAVGKSRKSIASLMDIRPDRAFLLQGDGTVIEKNPEDIALGDILVISPGERVPLDGIVTEGHSALNTSALTGESIPRAVTVGDGIFSGCVNLSGVLHIRVTKIFAESAAVRILELVESAASKKAATENIVSRFAKIYTPIVCISAVITAVCAPLIRLLCHLPADWTVWLYRALSFLVISCPCALVISVPLAFFVSLGSLSANGILVKGSQYIEALAAVQTVAFDKTGTVTKGVFEVCGVHHGIHEDEKLLYYAAHAECFSAHPIARSLTSAYGKAIDKSLVRDVTEIGGHGISANVDGVRVLLGNGKLMDSARIPYKACHEVGTVIHMALDGTYAGHFLINDVIKSDAEEMMALLKKQGITKTVLLTGDNRECAEDISRRLHVDTFVSDLLPEGKVAEIERLLAEKKKNKAVAFVGDGINDSPVLTRADIGISMGKFGTDAAVESSDIVIMDDTLTKIPLAVSHAKRTLRIVKENLIFTVGIKILCLFLTMCGFADMTTAVFADVGVMILAVLNALRAGRRGRRRTSRFRASALL